MVLQQDLSTCASSCSPHDNLRRQSTIAPTSYPDFDRQSARMSLTLHDLPSCSSKRPLNDKQSCYEPTQHDGNGRTTSDYLPMKPAKRIRSDTNSSRELGQDSHNLHFRQNADEILRVIGAKLQGPSRMMGLISESVEIAQSFGADDREVAVRICPICLDAIDERSLLSPAGRLPCGHLMHRACSQRWLLAQAIKRGSIGGSCPVCRKHLAIEDIEFEDVASKIGELNRKDDALEIHEPDHKCKSTQTQQRRSDAVKRAFQACTQRCHPHKNLDNPYVSLAQATLATQLLVAARDKLALYIAMQPEVDSMADETRACKEKLAEELDVAFWCKIDSSPAACGFDAEEFRSADALNHVTTWKPPGGSDAGRLVKMFFEFGPTKKLFPVFSDASCPLLGRFLAKGKQDICWHCQHTYTVAITFPQSSGERKHITFPGLYIRTEDGLKRPLIDNGKGRWCVFTRPHPKYTRQFMEWQEKMWGVAESTRNRGVATPMRGNSSTSGSSVSPAMQAFASLKETFSNGKMDGHAVWIGRDVYGDSIGCDDENSNFIAGDWGDHESDDADDDWCDDDWNIFRAGALRNGENEDEDELDE